MTNEESSPATSADVAAKIIAAGRVSWPTVLVDTESLTRYVAERGLNDAKIGPSLACDLFLAFACLSGAPNAIGVFQSTHERILVSVARRLDKSGELLDELRQRMAELLFTGRDGRPGRIADYSGRGPLSAWVRTCAKRVALRLLKQESSELLMAPDALAEEISDTCDQELALLKEHYGEVFRAALVSALNELPAKDRMLLQLHLVAGLSTTRIAKMFHLNQSSVSRQVRRAAASTFSIMKQHVHLRLGTATTELESLLDLARSHIEFTFSSLDEIPPETSVDPSPKS